METNLIENNLQQADENIPLDAGVGMPPLQLNEIYNDDSFKLIERVPAKTVDLILEDMPYNTTACEWDVKIDLQLYWETRLRILKPTGVIVLTAQQPFVSDLINSNREIFRYEIIWNKELPVGFLNANKMPLRVHENVLIFYRKLPTYNPIKTKGKPYKKNGTGEKSVYSTAYMVRKPNLTGERMPTTILDITNANHSNPLHPTQKPVGLFEYLIRTYSNEGDLVFDGFGGSGTTAVAAHKSKRNFIVIEKEKKYFDLATRRLCNERAQYTML